MSCKRNVSIGHYQQEDATSLTLVSINGTSPISSQVIPRLAAERLVGSPPISAIYRNLPRPFAR